MNESYNQQKKHISERERMCERGGGRGGESRGERGLAVDRETDR